MKNDIKTESQTSSTTDPAQTGTDTNEYGSALDQGFDSYTLENLSVKDPNVSTVSVQTQASPTHYESPVRSIPKRRALVISSLITLIVFLITVGSVFIFSKSNQNNQSFNSASEQNLNLDEAYERTNIPGFDESSDSLFINGDIIARGVIKISQGNFVADIQANDITGNRTYSLPDDSGVICIDTNNCNFITAEEFAILQAQVGQIIVPNVPDGTSINGFTNAVTVAGTANQVNVSSSNGLITLSAPQNIATDSSPTFSNLTLSNNLTVGGTLQLNLNCTGFQNGGALTTTASGQLVCSDDNDSGGTGFVNSINSLTGVLNIAGSAGQVNIVQSGGDTFTFSLAAAVSLLGQTIELAELSANSVNSSKIVDGSVANIDLANSTITVTAGNGLANGGLVALGGVTTLNIGAGNGITVNADDITLNLQANKGLEVDGNGLSLIDCGNGQVLKYETTGNTWGCAADADTGGAPTNANYIVFGSLDPSLTNERQLTFGTNLQSVDGGANGTLAVSVVNNPTFSGLITANGGLTFGAGQSLTLNGDSFTDLTGTGLQVVGNALQAVLGTSIDSGEIVDGTIQAIDLESTNVAGAGTDNYVITYDNTTGGFTWVDPAVAGGPRVDSLNSLTGDLSILGSGQITVTDGVSDITLTITNDSIGDTQLAFNTGQHLTTTSSVIFNGLSLVNGLTISGDTINDFTGTGLQVVANALQTTLGTSVDLTSEVNGILPVANGGTGQSTLNDLITLATHTTGSYVASITAGSGLTGDINTENGAANLAIGAGNGITVNADDITLNLQANKGLEVDGNGLSLIDCAVGQILKYNGSNQWACAADNYEPDTNTTYTAGNDLNLVGTTFNLDAVLNTVTDIIRDSGNLTLQTTTSGNIVLDSAGTIDLLGQTNVQGQLYLGTDSGINGALSFYNSTNSNTVTLQSGVTGASYALTLPTGLGSTNQCLKAQNGTGTLFWDDCLGGGGGGISGSGTNGTIARFSPNGTTLGDSSLTDNGTNATATGDFTIQGGDLTLGQAAGSTGSIVFHDNDGVGGQTVTLTAPDVTTSYGLTLPTAAGSNTDCLRVDGTGQLYFDTCSGGGSGSGVDSLRSLTGALNLQGTANEVEVTDNATDTITIGLPSDVIIGNTLTVTGLATLNGGLTVQNGDTFTFGGNGYTSLTGIGLQFNAGSLETTLGTSVDLTSEVTGILPVTNGGTGQSTLNNLITLTTHTVGDYVASFTAGGGLTGNATGEGSTPTLAIGAGNGITVNPDDITLNLQANKGLEVDGNGLSLIDCADGQVLKYETTGNTWGCAADAGGSGVGDDILINGANADGANFLNSAASATEAAITWGLNTVSNPDEITISVGAANGTQAGIVTANAQTFGGDKTFNGQIVANGNIGSTGALSITPGGALTVGSTGQSALLQGSTTTITSTGAGNDITLTSADALILTATGNITLTGLDCTGNLNGGKLTTDASGNISCQDDVDTDTNTTYTAGSDLDLVGTVFSLEPILNSVTDIIRDSGNLTLQTTTSGNIVLDSAGTIELQGNTNVTGTLGVSGLATFDSALRIYDGTANYFTINAEGALGGDYNVSIPTEIAGNDFFCLENAGNCSGTAQNLFATISAPAGTNPVADSSTDILNLAVTGTNLTVTGDAGTDTITFDISESTLAGNGLGVSGDALVINTGNGIQLTADAVTLNLQANKGLEVDGNGLSLIDCGNGQVLKYETTGNTWACNADIDTDTTYSAGNDLDLSGTTFNIESQLDFVTDIVRDSGNLTLQTTTSGNIILNSAGTIELQDNTNITGSLLATGNGTFQGGSLTVGQASTTNGTLTLLNSTNAFGVTLSGANQTTGSVVISFPDTGADTADTICLQDVGNCSGAGASSVGTIDSQTKSADGAVITSNTLYLQTADNSNPGLVSTGSQIFAGDKTFNGSVTLAAQQTLTITGSTTINRPAGTEGQIYYDTDTNQLLTFANGKWQGDRTTATKIVAANNSPQTVKDSADYVADGTADQTEINAAITAAAGGTVYLAEGTYNITATINMTDNTTLSGAGQGATTLFIPNATDLAFAALTLSGTNNFTLRDFTVDGNQANQTTKNTRGIHITSSGGPGLIENVTSKNNGGSGIEAGSADDITINNVTVEGNLDRGIYLSSGTGNTVSNNRSIANSDGTGSTDAGFYINSNNTIITGNYLDGDNSYAVTGSLFVTGDRNTVTNNTVVNAQNNAITLGVTAKNTTVTGNVVSEPAGDGIRVDGANATVSSNSIYNPGASAILAGGGSDTITITGNDIFYETSNTTTSNAIALANGASQFLISNNTVTNAGAGGIAVLLTAGDGVISNNRIHNSGVNSTGADGIEVSSFSALPIQIIGNHITDTAGTGFAIDVNVAGVYLADNIYSGTGASSIDAVAGTIYGGQVSGAGDFVIQPAGEISLNADTNVTGTLSVTTLGSADSDTLLCHNSSNELATCSSTFVTDATNDFVRNGTTTQTANFNIQSAAAGSIGGIIQGHASQTADLLQIRNGASAVLASVTADGILKVGTTAAPTLAGAKLLVNSGEFTTNLRLGNGTNRVEWDSTSSKLRFVGAARNDITVSLVPEFVGATFRGDGSDNTGYLTSDFCSVSERRNINTADCDDVTSSTNEYSYYEWTTSEGSAQDYDVYVRYRLPSDFGEMTSINVAGFKSTVSDDVRVSIYDADDTGTPCVNNTQVATTATDWTNPALTTGSCGFNANDIIVFRFRVTATNGNFARLGDVSIVYKSIF